MQNKCIVLTEFMEDDSPDGRITFSVKGFHFAPRWPWKITSSSTHSSFICEFDDEFINMYRSLRLQIFFNFEFEVKNYRQDKVLLSIEKFDEKTIPMNIPEEGLIMAEIMNE